MSSYLLGPPRADHARLRMATVLAARDRLARAVDPAVRLLGRCRRFCRRLPVRVLSAATSAGAVVRSVWHRWWGAGTSVVAGVTRQVRQHLAMSGGRWLPTVRRQLIRVTSALPTRPVGGLLGRLWLTVKTWGLVGVAYALPVAGMVLRVCLRPLVAGYAAASVAAAALFAFRPSRLTGPRTRSAGTGAVAAPAEPGEQLSREEICGVYEAMLTLEAAVHGAQQAVDAAPSQPMTVAKAGSLLQDCRRQVQTLQALQQELHRPDGERSDAVAADLRADIAGLLARVVPNMDRLEAHLAASCRPGEPDADVVVLHAANREQRRAAQRNNKTRKPSNSSTSTRH